MVATRDDDDVQTTSDQEYAAAHEQQPPLVDIPGFAPYDPKRDGSEDEPADDRRVNKEDSGGLLRQHLAEQETTAGGAAAASGLEKAKNVAEKPGKKTSKDTSWLGKSGAFLFKRKGWAIGGGAVVILIIVAIIFILSLLKIPSLAADVTGIEFTRWFRQLDNSIMNISEEALAYQTAGNKAVGKSSTLRQALQDEYAGEGRLFRGIRGLAVDKIANNLGIADKLRLDYAPGSENILKSISLLDDAGKTLKTVAIPEPSALDRIIPGWRTYTKGISDARLGSQLAELISAGFRDSGVSRAGFAVRASVLAELLRNQIGAKWIGFDAAALAKFATANRETSDALAIQNSVDATGAGPKADPHSTIPGENDALVEADHVLTEGSHDLEQIAKPPTLLKKAGNAVRTGFARNGPVQEVAKVADPLYLLALTMCTVYEGSMERSGPAINTNIFNLMNLATHEFAIADQEKSGGPPGLANALQGANDQLGDISTSVPYMKANGVSVDTSKAMASPEADAMGNFTLLNASVPPDKFSQAVANMVLNPAAEKVCGGLLSPQGVIAAIAIQVAILAGTLGASSGGEVATDVAANAGSKVLADELVDQAATRVVTRITAQSVASAVGRNIATKGFWSRIGTFLFKEGIKLGGIVAGTDALTFAAQYYVYFYSHWFWSGMEQNEDLANEVGAGGNLLANLHEQTTLFGRPMTCTEIRENDQLDKTYVAESDQAQGPLYRYLSSDNPRSLLTRTASMVQAGKHSAFGPNGTVANIFTLPLQAFGSLVGSITGVASAATPCANENYGNIQFGWSKSEEDLINSSDSYLPLQNQKILDQSHKSAAIADEYSYCFGYDYNSGGDGTFDPTDPNGDLVLDVTGDNANDGKNGSIGMLLQNGDIARTADGDIVPDKGNCSPKNLGVNNPDYGDLVFRWRLARRYEAALNQLQNLQTVTK